MGWSLPHIMGSLAASERGLNVLSKNVSKERARPARRRDHAPAAGSWFPDSGEITQEAGEPVEEGSQRRGAAEEKWKPEWPLAKAS